MKKFVQIGVMLLSASLLFWYSTFAQENVSIKTIESLKLAIDTVNDGDVIVLDPEFVSGDIELVTQNVSYTIDGNGVEWDKGSVNIKGDGSGSITLENIIFDNPNASNNYVTIQNTAGSIHINNMIMENSNTGVFNINSGSDAHVRISNTLIKNNKNTNGASAIWVSSNAKVLLEYVTIEDNTTFGGGYECGAIASKNYYGSLSIKNSVFKNNKNGCSNTGLLGGGGGAMSMHYFRGNVSIDASYFEGNETNGKNTDIKNTYDGGAIYVLDGRDGAVFNITNSTFTNNVAYDDGGAILFQGTGNPGFETLISNSTFYMNKAYGLDGANYSGGAIQYFKNGGSSKMVNTIYSSTFVLNQAGNEKSTISQRGGALGLSGAGLFANAAVSRFNSLFIGNRVFDENGAEHVESMYKDISNYTTTQSIEANFINRDKGDNPEYTLDSILGKKENHLVVNQSNVKAGYEKRVVPTIPFLPMTLVDNSYALSNTLAPKDQRDLIRYKDHGAIEMSWIRYEANGGIFKLDPLKTYDGTHYYQGNNPTTYYDIKSNKIESNTLDSHELNLSRDGYRFIGWLEEDTNTLFKVNDNIEFKDDNRILVAQWEEVLYYNMSFESNGGTLIAPQTVEKDLKFMEPKTPLKEGYTFVGWYVDSVFSELYDFDTPATQNLTLYAKWEANKIQLDFVTGFDVEVASQIVDYGHVFIKPETLDREGYTFIGWYVDSVFSELYDFDAPATQNLTLYAKWEVNEEVVDPELPQTGIKNQNGGVQLIVVGVLVIVLTVKKRRVDA